MTPLPFRRYFSSFDLQTALRQGMVYGLLIFVIAGLFFSAEFVTEKFFYNNDEVVDILAAIVGAFAFSHLRDACAFLTDRIFFRGQYDYREAVQELSQILGGTIDLQELLRSIAEFLAKTVKPETVVFCWGSSEEILAFDNPATSRNRMRRDAAYRALAAQFRTLIGRLFFVDEFESDDPIALAAREIRVASIVPFFSKNGAAIFMMVGDKLSGEPLPEKDRALLRIMAHQASMAIENAHLYDALREHSEVLERRVAEKTERIKEMYRAQSKFLADVAHEFQTPIAILSGNLGLLAAKNTGRSERANALYIATTTLDRLSRLVSNLLDVARLNFSKDGARKRTMAVKNLLEAVRDDCGVLTEDKGVVFTLASENLFIAGDKDKLKEVLLNLVSNALKHTPAGGTISLSGRRAGDLAIITVADTGRGIAPENLARIFERFYKIDKRGLSESAGNGIGLHLCRQIVEAHSGTIVAESEPGRGSRFVIHLPLASPQALMLPAPAARVQPATQSAIGGQGNSSIKS